MFRQVLKKIPSKNYISKLKHIVISKNSGLQKFEYSTIYCEKKPAALVQINSPRNKNLTILFVTDLPIPAFFTGPSHPQEGPIHSFENWGT
jgi:hypothetical protein